MTTKKVKPQMPEFMQKINWKLLREQKANLLDVINLNEVNPRQKEALEGILSTLDALQDSAVDVFGVPEELVFDKE